MSKIHFTPEQQQIRIEALNIASREAVSRAYGEMPTVEIAEQMVAFIEGEAPA